MKVVIVKEALDELGPYSSFEYRGMSFKKLLNQFKTKANGVHTFLAFQADSIILNQPPSQGYKQNIPLERQQRILSATTNTYNLKDISWGSYDVVWCRDAILGEIDTLRKNYPQTLFIYENVEHAFAIMDPRYDIILNHVDFSFTGKPNKQGLTPFPYVINPAILRKNINCSKKRGVYLDSRDIYEYAEEKNIKDKYKNLQQKFKTFNINLNSLIPRPEFCYREVNDIQSNTYNYLKRVGEAEYFALLADREGQALVEAAALGCIVIGNGTTTQSKLICHPVCRVEKFLDGGLLRNKILALQENAPLKKEILEYQNTVLDNYYYKYQERLIRTALYNKRGLRVAF